MNVQRRTAIILIAALMSTSCTRGELRRTDVSEWETRTFQGAGVQIDLPRHVDVARASKEFGLVVMMHSIAPGIGVLADTQFLISLEVSRTTAAELAERFESLKDDLDQTPENSLRFWMADRHDTIAARVGDEYSYYRYDITCANGEVLSINVEARHPIIGGVRKFQNEDDITIRRILRSVKCMEV
jgi:hypothetical protein